MRNIQRRTKIVCTIGPSTNTLEGIEALVKSGMNVARLNFSHGSHEDHAKVIDMIRKTARKFQYSIPILADLQGPKIRVGKMKDGGQHLEDGSYVNLTPEDVEGSSSLIPIDYAYLAQDAREGNTILLDDGLLEFKIVKIDEANITARVVNGGLLKSRKGVNLPSLNLSISSITEKDYADLDFAINAGVDLVALSFVRKAEDVQELVSKIRAGGSNAGVIAKIEKPEALDVIDEIIEEVDGIMVARGDLGIEIPSEKVPMVQKKIIESCRMAGKPVITATQMLDSMISNPRPTRAESSDVANAIIDGTDAVMLSGETAAGKHPFEAVRVMARICRSVETNSDRVYHTLPFRQPERRDKQVFESLSYSCVEMAQYVGAKAIAVITQSGTTAKRIAKYRPGVPVFAFTENQVVRRQLNLVWGVHSIKLSRVFDTDSSVQIMEDYMREAGLVGKGERIIIASGMPISERGRTNMIKISTL